MRTTLNIDDDVMKFVMEETKASTKTEAVRQALDDYVRRRKIERLIALGGKVSLPPPVMTAKFPPTLRSVPVPSNDTELLPACRIKPRLPATLRLPFAVMVSSLIPPFGSSISIGSIPWSRERWINCCGRAKR